MATHPHSRLWLILGLAAAPLVTYVALQLLVTIAPDRFEGYAFGQTLIVVAIVLGGLFVPYLMLKGVFASEHERNPAEETLKLGDFIENPEENRYGHDAMRVDTPSHRRQSS